MHYTGREGAIQSYSECSALTGVADDSHYLVWIRIITEKKGLIGKRGAGSTRLPLGKRLVIINVHLQCPNINLSD